MKQKFGSMLGIAVIMMMFTFTLPCYAAQTVEVVDDGQLLTVNVNGEKISFDQPPYISNRRTMVPFRPIAEALGAKVDWDEIAMKVTIKGTKVVELTIGSTEATVDGMRVTLDAPAAITGGRTMVPLRFIGEALGAGVVYNQTGKPASPKTILDNKVEEVVAKTIKPDMPDLDKAYAIYRYVINNSLYGYGPHCYVAYGNLIDGVSVCSGFADAIHLLLDAAGVENYVVQGHLTNIPDEGHAWNIIRIDNNYYYVDGAVRCFLRSGHIRDLGGYPTACEYATMPPQVPDVVDYWFIKNGYIYYPLGWSPDGSSKRDIYRVKPDGSENTKVFTTQHTGTEFVEYNDWIYYFDYFNEQGIFKVRLDGSEDTKVSDITGIDKIRLSNGYLFVEQSGSKELILYRINLENNQEDKIVDEQNFEHRFFVEGIGDYIYYGKPENGVQNLYKVSLDGKQKTLLLTKGLYD